AAVCQQRSHFAGELAEVLGEEAFVLPVEVGWGEKFAPIEKRADANLDAADVLHQDEVRALVVFPAIALQSQHRDDVVAVLHFADVVACRRESLAAEFENVASASARNEIDRGVEIIELMRCRGEQSDVAQHFLAECAIGFESIAECAAADDAISLFTQTVLRFAPSDSFEKDEAALTNPGQFRLPVAG